MGDWRQMGHAARRRMGAPTNHFGAAMANPDEEAPRTISPEEARAMTEEIGQRMTTGSTADEAGSTARRAYE